MAVLPKKRYEPPLTPAASVDGSEGFSNIAQQQPQSVEGGLDATPALLKKRNEPPLTPAASVDDSEGPSNIAQQPQSVEGGLDAKAEDHDKVQEPPKKKRRVALTRVGDLES